jgi:hypothetical protein
MMRFGPLFSVSERAVHDGPPPTSESEDESSKSFRFLDGLFRGKEKELERQRMEQERLIKEQLKELGMEKELEEEKKLQGKLLHQVTVMKEMEEERLRAEAEVKARRKDDDDESSDLSDDVSGGGGAFSDDDDDELVRELKENGLPPVLICNKNANTRVSRMSIRRDSYMQDLMHQKQNRGQAHLPGGGDGGRLRTVREIHSKGGSPEESEALFVEIFERVTKEKENEAKAKDEVLDQRIEDEKWKIRTTMQPQR